MEKVLWLDIETTGLSEIKDEILEIGMIVTDKHYAVLDQFEVVIGKDSRDLLKMNDWCRKTHTESGLVDHCLYSQVSIYEASDKACEFIKLHFPDSKPVLHGNSVHFDKKFIDLHMPDVRDLLHYRLVDVSSVKEFLRPLGITYKADKPVSHRAIEDILGSISEAAYYRNHICYCPLRETLE